MSMNSYIYISYQTLVTEFLSLLLAPQHYHSYQSAVKEVYSHFQPLSITPLISLSQRNFNLTFSPSTFRISSSQSNFIVTFNPSSSHFLSVPREGISFSISAPQHYFSYQSLAEEFHFHVQPLNITFRISPLQKNFIVTFIPSTLHFLSVPRKGISSILSNHQHYISYQSLAKEFHPYFQPSTLRFFSVRRKGVSSSLTAPQHHFLSVPHKK